VLILADYFLRKFSQSMQRDAKRLSPGAARAFCQYDWPGNVRELEHTVEHAMVLAKKEVISVADLPFSRELGAPRRVDRGIRPVAAVVATASVPLLPGLADLGGVPYAEAKRRFVTLFDDTYTGELLRQTGGNMSEAARLAKLDRSNFRRLLKRHHGSTGARAHPPEGGKR
jgi:DNA-binding NtrC family response regulator